MTADLRTKSEELRVKSEELRAGIARTHFNRSSASESLPLGGKVLNEVKRMRG